MIIATEAIRSEHAANQCHMGLLAAEISNMPNTLGDLRSDKFYSLLQSTSLGHYALDCASVCIFINRAGAEMLGYSPDELVGKKLHSLVHHTRADGSIYPEEKCPIHDASRDGYGVRGEDEVFWRKDGTSFAVEYSSCPLQGQSIGGKVVAFTDISERKRKNEELYALSAFLENAVEGISRLDCQGRYVSVNRTYASVVGYRPDEMQGMSWEATVYPDDREKVRDAYNQMLACGKAACEARGMRKDGSIVCKQLVLIKAQNPNGDFVGHHCFMKDITEKKIAEEVLHREREFLRAVLDTSDDVIVACDSAGVLNLFNHAARELHGQGIVHLPPSEWSQQYGLYAPGGKELLAPEEAPLIRALRGERVRNAEVVVKTPAGEDRIRLANARALYDSGGHLLGAVVVHHDISEQRISQDAQHKITTERDRLLQQLQLHIELLPLPFVLFDSDFCVSDWNPAAERVFGYSKAEMLGERPPYTKFVSAGNWPGGEDIRHRVRSGDMAAHCTNENRTKDGRTITCEWFNTPLMLDDGRIGGMVCIAQDITKRLSMEEQLRQSHRMEAIGQLAGGVAHDFNNLLTVIINYSIVLLDSLRFDDPARKMLKEIRKAGENSALLTRQLLAFSRKQLLVPKVLDLNEVVCNTEKILRRFIGEDINLVTVLHPRLFSVKADPSQLDQVLINLAVNARDAMPAGGKLSIETSNVNLDETHVKTHAAARTGQYAMLMVSDSGTGMTEEVKRHLFEPFFSTKGSGKGTGLGLSVVYGIVKQSDGHIEVDSKFGAGSSFKIFLPRVEEPERRSEAIGEAPPTQTILLVEDEEAVRTLTSHILQGYGYAVLEAGDGDEALRIGTQHREPIHLLLSDIVMPEMGGPLLAKRLLPIHPETAVLFMSGYTDDIFVRHGISESQVNFLQKPFLPTTLIQKIRDVLAMHV